MTYDSVYGQLPVSETATVSTSGVTTLSTTVPMSGTPGWDRGTGGVRRVVDPNGFETTVTYDGFGRLTSMTPPAVGACASHPATVITYDITTDGAARPASRVLTTSYLGAHDDPTSLCAADGDVIETVGFMDGLGRPRASLTTADYTGQWIRYSANQRTVKATYDVDTDKERVALYVYSGDFERRGLTRGLTAYIGMSPLSMRWRIAWPPPERIPWYADATASAASPIALVAPPAARHARSALTALPATATTLAVATCMTTPTATSKPTLAQLI